MANPYIMDDYSSSLVNKTDIHYSMILYPSTLFTCKTLFCIIVILYDVYCYTVVFHISLEYIIK